MISLWLIKEEWVGVRFKGLFYETINLKVALFSFSTDCSLHVCLSALKSLDRDNTVSSCMWFKIWIEAYTLSLCPPPSLKLSLSVSHPRGKSSCQPSAHEGPCRAPGDRDPVCQWVATLGDAWNSGSPLSLIPGLYLSVFLPSDELSVTDEAGQCEDVHLSIQRMCITVRAVLHTRGLIFCRPKEPESRLLTRDICLAEYENVFACLWL